MRASVEDAYGNVVTTASGNVSVAFASNPTSRLWRDADGDRVGRRGKLHQPDDQQDRVWLHAPGIQHGADLGDE